MAPSDRFKSIHRIAQSQERSAGRWLAAAQHSLNDAEAQLEELGRYRQDYLQQFTATMGLGLSARRVQEYQAFLARLNRAITEQEAKVRASHQDRECHQERWRSRRTRSQALEKVMERGIREERAKEEKREQRELDEYAQWSRFFAT